MEPTKDASEYEDPVDRFEHEIEELERPMGHGFQQWIVGMLFAVFVVGGVFVAAFFVNKGTTSAAKKSDLTMIEILEPKRGSLNSTPYVFRWDSIAGTDHYLVRVQKEGSPMDLISRQTRVSMLELTPDEREKLGTGGRFTWVVQAQTRGGQALAQGESTFTF